VGSDWNRRLSNRTLAGTSREIQPEPDHTPSGGSVALIALLVPALMMLLMLALEAFEDYLFPPSSSYSEEPGRTERAAAVRAHLPTASTRHDGTTASVTWRSLSRYEEDFADD
jgi:hypothetical protein